MREGGISSVFDLLVFSLLVSTASLLLADFRPVDASVGNEVYASSLARSALLTIQNSNVEKLGGLNYQLSGLSCLPVIGDSAKRSLQHRTFGEILADDAFLNMGLELLGENVNSGLNEDLNEKLLELLKQFLDSVFGGRFGYRLRAHLKQPNLEFFRLRFEVVVENLSGASRMLCSETAVLTLPNFETLETNLAVLLTLEVWAK